MTVQYSPPEHYLEHYLYNNNTLNTTPQKPINPFNSIEVYVDDVIAATNDASQ